MYTEFYRLSHLPFQLTPDARFFFESSVHRQAMSYLVYGLHHAEGFIVITGEVGAGKTMLVENLLSTISDSEFVIAKIVTTQLQGDDLLRMVAAGFGIGQENIAKGSLLRRIEDFVVSQRRTGKRALLIVDEAQNLSFAALEELRMLSNLMSGRSMAMQSFLLGQPQFRAVLANPELEQLRQRITAAYHLGPLNESETRSYIEHRLRLADWQGDPSFSDDCFPLLHKLTGGVPRRINTLCSRLLLYGFLEGLHALTAAAVEQVGGDLEREVAFAAADRVISAAPGQDISLATIAKQLAHLERTIDRHERVIKQAIAIASRYLQDQQS
jgi:putative secretion ATPase (PEP-CTERM system associated)